MQPPGYTPDFVDIKTACITVKSEQHIAYSSDMFLGHFEHTTVCNIHYGERSTGE